MRQAYIVAGLGYGDEGKGTITDYLCRQEDVSLVIRYNGGAQAGHNVVTDDGEHHTFSQFGSGTFAGVPTFLSKYMIVNPITLLAEAKALRDSPCPWARVIVDKDCLVTTPFHMAVNRLREIARGKSRHGSCGMGVGETMMDNLTAPQLSVFVKDLSDVCALHDKLRTIQERKRKQIEDLSLPKTDEVDIQMYILRDEHSVADIIERYRTFLGAVEVADSGYLQERLGRDETFVFEGAQGVLLDEDHGFYPHNTWTNTTFANALKILDGTDGQITKVGVLRSYATRHGAGPFVTEDPSVGSLIKAREHNKYTPWQENFRVGYFDLVAARYAAEVSGGIDQIALTHLDLWWLERAKVCVKYQGWDRIPISNPLDLDLKLRITQQLFEAEPVYEDHDLLTLLSSELKAPVAIASFGQQPKHKIRGENFGTRGFARAVSRLKTCAGIGL